MVLACVWFTVLSGYHAFSGEPLMILWALILWLPLAVGLWRLMQWARFLALCVLGYIAMAVQMTVSFWAAMNGENPPLPIWQALNHEVVPVFVPVAFLIELLFAYGGEFRWDRASERSRSSPMPPRSWLLWSAAVFAVPALMVTSQNRAIDLHKGCFEFGGVGMGPFWHVLPYALISSGAALFLYAAPVGASRIHRTIRVIIYVVVMIFFLGNVGSYIEYRELCSPAR
jgi:hypothetical protein